MRRALSVLLCLLGVALTGFGTRIYVKAAVAQVLLQQAWLEARAGGGEPRPWPWADTWPVARLRSPEHDVDLIVLRGATGSSIAFAPGHITGTAEPGRPGNVGIAAHRDTHFAFLEQLRRGERLWLDLPDGRAVEFMIDTLGVVHESDGSSLAATGDKLTLVTCFPFHATVPGGPWRYVVQARAV
jgi:sortase A